MRIPKLIGTLIMPLSLLALIATACAQRPPANQPELATSLPSPAATRPAPTTVPTRTPPPATPTLPPPTPTPSVTLSTVASPVLTSISMKDSTHGWGLTEQKVLRTADGGATWEDATPTGGAAVNPGARGFFLDAQTAWVLVPAEDFMSGTLYRTADAGATWQPSNTPFGGAQLFFLDAQNGWALFVPSAGAGSAEADVFQTADGGQTWSEVYKMDTSQPEAAGGLPLAGSKNGLSFRDPQHGWVTGSEPMDGYAWLFATQDGGRTWQHQDLALPKGYESAMLSIDPPVFFTAQDGLLPVDLYADSTSKVFYTTHDGGRSWSATTIINHGGLYDFPNPQDGFVWNGGSAFSMTHDGGQSYQTITPNVNLNDVLGQIDFVDASTGWARTMDANGVVRLYRTSDGGATWTPLW
jgi:photosystem II stability/assembly factor-like uncharacterized protein